MSGKSYSENASNNEAADKAAKKAEEEVEKIKREAQEQLSSGKVSYNNPDDS